MSLLSPTQIDKLVLTVERLITVIERQIRRQPEPVTFIESFNNTLSSNVADGVIIIQSPIIPHRKRGVVKDLNINFTTVAGTIRVVKINSQGTILVDLNRSIAASSSGVGGITLQEGQAIAIAGQVAGAGTFGASFSGEIVNLD